MRLLLFLIALLIFIPKTHSQDAFKMDDLAFLGAAGTAAVGGPTYLLTENWEDTGFNGWTTAGTWGGTLDPDASTSGLSLEGAQCLHLITSTLQTNCYKSFTTTANVWAFFWFRWVSAASAYTFYFRNATTTLGYVQLGSTGRLTVNVTGGSTTTTADSMTANTTYGIWINYIQGSGADAKMDVRFAASPFTKPASSAGPWNEATGGTSTLAPNVIRLGTAINMSAEYYIDKVRVSDASVWVIGDNPD